MTAHPSIDRRQEIENAPHCAVRWRRLVGAIFLTQVAFALPPILAAAPLLQAEAGSVRLVVEKLPDGTLHEQYLARAADGTWREIAAGLHPRFTGAPQENKFFDTRVTPHRYAAEEILTEGHVESPGASGGVTVQLRGSRAGRMTLTKTIRLRADSAWIEVEFDGGLEQAELDYFRSSLTFAPLGQPDFVHSPTVKQEDHFRSGPARDQVIGDHAFHSPALILQKGSAALALVPRLDLINSAKVLSDDARGIQRVARNKFSVPLEPANNSMPSALDLNVVSGLTDQPVLSYGFMDFVVSHHIRYQRTNDAAMVRHLHGTRLRFGYDLLITAEATPLRAYQTVSRYLWTRHGHAEFTDASSPQLAMPVVDYVQQVYRTVSKPMDPKIQAPVPGYADRGVFLDFELGGVPVGGMVSPLPSLGFGDALWNFEFWNNVRDAAGMYFWGRRLANEELQARARRIINLALRAPQNERGFFPLIFQAKDRQWRRSSLGPRPRGGYTIFAHENVWFSVPAMSKTAAHLADYYDWCERDESILAYLVRYADGLLRLLPEDGALASYFDGQMQPVPVLVRSAQPAASMWFLARIAKLTGRADYLGGARRIATYLEREILPQQRWLDLEPYLSCGQNPLGVTSDTEQGLPVRGNLALIWAAEGYLALHDVTGRAADLAHGEAVADYLAFSQASWRPHYVYTANPFGGCTADNVDTATWLEARQCELVHPFLKYGLRLGRPDLMERGVAAARSGIALINLERHRVNGIYRHPNIYGEGLGPENINHEGHNQSAMRTHPSWGECSAIFTGLGMAARLLGGGYVDCERGLAVPVEPIGLNFQPAGANRVATVTVTNRINNLLLPWPEAFPVTLRFQTRDALEERTLIVGEKAQTVDCAKVGAGARDGVRPGGSPISR